MMGPLGLFLIAFANLLDVSYGCNVTGNWYDSQSTPNQQLVFRIQDVSKSLMALAVTYNPNWVTGKVEYDPSKSDIVLYLDDGEIINGTMASDCSNITWPYVKATWIKAPKVDSVHVIFMNHLDVGYAQLAVDIINEYFTVYFPRAIRLAEEFNYYRNDESFIYTTQPWLISLYLNCPPNIIFNGTRVQCPSSHEVQVFDNAIKKGYIAWHAGPMNMQIEFMNKAVLEASLKVAQDLNKRYGITTSVLSQRDVPGMTACAIPTFVQYGIKAVSVGVNSGSAPPAVPKIFNWRNNGSSVIGIWHAGGYPNDPGRDLEGARGISYHDCTVAPGSTNALCFAFRTDNTGPPRSLDEIDRQYQILREEFPEARVFASTLDAYAQTIDINSLPVVDQEIGDTWIVGVASDPHKSASYRAMSVGLSQCIQDKACDLSDPIVANATRFLIKLPEHTWGLSGVHNDDDWTNTDFQKARSTSDFVRNEQSWVEQRMFINLTLEASQGHKLYDYMTDNLNQQQTTTTPDLSQYTEIDPSKVYTVYDGKVTIGFDSTEGTVNNLVYNVSHKAQYTYATSYRPLGEFSYITYNDTDFDFMMSRYDYAFNAGFEKPGSQDSANPKSDVWPTKLVSLYQSKSKETLFLTHLVIYDTQAHTYYGAPSDIWIAVELILINSETPPVLRIDFDLTWYNKTATRLPEAIMYSFFPCTPFPSTYWVATLSKIDKDSSFNVGDVVNNGSQYQHVVDHVSLSPSKQSSQHSDAVFLTPEDSSTKIIINSTDVPLLCPITGDGRSPTPFPVPLETLGSDNVIGVAFNMHNNIWNTNYPLYYPFIEGDKNFRARFTLVMYH